ncbi:flagellar hook-basal body protein FliE [Antarctobacter heliothermus]|uniref:Flagellar hook-basal body complex protein FliE n=1 Tax=Antarctobacter heliothermus TaxID=74033 RepID=A0A222E0P3_9RHOB|nr:MULTISPECIES: flagellar hook-basal body complex protein FliE [Antarctobacter]ASP19779.1 flagellar hook-basal body protein FliE [Antarctobacter heliothermus]MBT52665.1 flagellar hook-basal body protein FliE [Mameliella sp.]SNS11173.1 flagellar hook-basal body complex protein FliE [Antarctobacter heliothermus]|tara:strand:- start:6219 stop:6512 length:294 start_codon:yes stop_codon:yes gene_type:complete
MDVRSLFAAQKYAASRPAMQPEPEQAVPLEKDFTRITEEFVDQLRQAEETAKTAMTSDADPHALVEALAQSELAVETVVAVRDKVVEAYQEILRMPV